MKNEPENDGVEIASGGAADTVAATSSAPNASEAETVHNVEQEVQQEESEAKPEEKKDDKDVPSPELYEAFANAVLSLGDGAFELVCGFIFEPEVDAKGLKKTDPESFKENVKLFAETLKLTKKQINEWLLWLTLIGTISIPYVNLAKQYAKESKKIRLSKVQAVKQPKKPAESVEEFQDAEEVVNHVNNVSETIKKRGNWRYHTQPCNCENCKAKRDDKGNILPQYK